MISRYDDYRRGVEEELRDIFTGREGFLYNLLRYHLGWVDQQGRPQNGDTALHLQGVVALASCEALGTDFRAALPAAAGVELAHHFTLVHGEVQAGRAEEPGRPSIWWVWGPAQAINAGDGLHALGRAAMMRLEQRGVAPEKVLEAVGALDQACLALCEGQYMDLSFQDQLMVTSADYYQMIDRKSGSVCACSGEVGALAGGGDSDARDRFRQWGSRLGMAWQISRDIADFGGQRQDGMTAGNLLNKKKSLPLIHALETSDNAAKRALGAIYAKRVLEPEDVSRVVAVLDAAGSRQYAEDKARELVAEAGGAVAELAIPDQRRRELEALGQMALDVPA